jgi:hypothetical protein
MEEEKYSLEKVRRKITEARWESTNTHFQHKRKITGA